MYFFWLLWGIDAIVALVFVYFFFVGLGDGTVSSFNGGLWLLILGGLTALLVGSYWLQFHEYAVLAKILLAIPAIPSLLYGLFILIMISSNTRWN